MIPLFLVVVLIILVGGLTTLCGMLLWHLIGKRNE
jgi:hypothetical protein